MQPYLRPSSEPLRWICPSSAIPAAHPYDPSNDMARLGSAGHKAMATVNPDLKAIAAEFGVKHFDLEDIYDRACAKRDKYFAEWGVVAPEYEVRMEGVVYAGTADVIDRARKPRPILIDWKMGYKVAEALAQIMAYAVLYNERYGIPDEGLDIAIVHVRHHEDPETRTVTREDLQKFLVHGRMLADQVGKVYTPGAHCGFCPRQLECDQVSAYHRAAAGSLVKLGDTEKLTPAKLGEAYFMCGPVEDQIEHIRKTCRMVAKHTEIPLPDGTSLGLTEQVNTVIDVSKAVDAMEFAGIPRGEILEECSLSQAGIKRLCAKHKVGFDQVMDDIKQARGVHDAKPFDKLYIKKGTRK